MWSANLIGLLCVATGLFILIGGYNYPSDWWLKKFVIDVYPNSGADLIGSAIVILIVDRFASRREDAQRLRQLVRECGSIDHAVANRALLELEARGGLVDGTLVRAQLSGADLARSRLESADLVGANLVGANLTDAHLSRARLTGAALGGADLTGAVLEWAELSHVMMSGANLSRVDAAGSRMNHADLSNADFQGADLARVDLTGADLSEANLRGAKLTDAVLDSAILYRAQYDIHTRWPADFVPPQDALRRGFPAPPYPGRR